MSRSSTFGPCFRVDVLAVWDGGFFFMAPAFVLKGYCQGFRALRDYVGLWF